MIDFYDQMKYTAIAHLFSLHRMARSTIHHIILFMCATSMYMSNGMNVITKDIGTVNFFEQDWISTFHLNLKSYVENALILRNTTKVINEICTQTPDDQNCKFFGKNIEANTDIVMRELNRMTKNQRVKRGFWMMALKTVLVQALVGVGIVAVTELVHSDQINDLEQNVEDLERKIAKQYKIQVMQNGIIRTMANDSMILQEKIMALNKTEYDRAKFDQLVDTATHSLIFHNRETTKYINIIRGDLRTNFFNVVDLEIFTEKLKFANQTLGKDGYIPTSNPFDAIDISTISYTNNGTHINVHVKTPILIHKPLTLFEYVPIPIRVDNELYILKSDPKFYYK